MPIGTGITHSTTLRYISKGGCPSEAAKPGYTDFRTGPFAVADRTPRVYDACFHRQRHAAQRGAHHNRQAGANREVSALKQRALLRRTRGAMHAGSSCFTLFTWFDTLVAITASRGAG